MTGPITVVCMLMGGPVQRLRVPDGRIWTFEMHPWCGPVVIDSATGNPMERQPSEKYPFWPAVDAWIAQGKLVDHHGLCHWVPPGDQPKLVHLGGRNYAYAGSKLAQKGS